MKQNKYSKSLDIQVEKKTEVKTSKEIELQIDDVEHDAVIVNIGGWRVRAYFDESLSKDDKENLSHGKILVRYFGDLEDIHSVKLLPLK
ncbi:hypothetical protein P4V41_07145 [Fictibacillus nanhaiensis]|uniref:hypothetical protein n=1 Tax=Fictibacillus nanhaiensis TaxID=742169 RepID=UPI002E25183D|nr:hypothetical protein [Fictibacillus nanhaiensis]